MPIARAPLLLLLACTSVACSMPFRTRTPRAPRRFFLTQATVQGGQALTACGRGSHMASRFEIVDPTVLQYDTELGMTMDDSGSGPPSIAASYESPGAIGWIRTGGGAQYSDASGPEGSAFANCSVWTTSSSQAFGTVAFLTDRSSRHDGDVGPWGTRSQRCDAVAHVWCVVDDARARPPSSEHRRRRPGSELGAGAP